MTVHLNQVQFQQPRQPAAVISSPLTPTPTHTTPISKLAPIYVKMNSEF